MTPANVDNLFRSLAAIIRASFASSLQTFLGGTTALPIANGGTGATDASSALAALGGLADDYRDLPITTKAGSFTLADSERGNAINYIGPAAVLTINPESTTAISYGAVYVIRNGGSGALTVTPGSGVTLDKNGAVSSSSAVIAIGGVATLIKWGTDFYTITGTGVS